MDVGATNRWRMDEVVPAAEIVAIVDAEFPIEPAERAATAARSRSAGATATARARSASSPRSPSRSAATARARGSRPKGKLYTCLFAVRGHDLRALIRGGASDEELTARLAAIWNVRGDRYSELRSEATVSTTMPRASR